MRWGSEVWDDRREDREKGVGPGVGGVKERTVEGKGKEKEVMGGS